MKHEISTSLNKYCTAEKGLVAGGGLGDAREVHGRAHVR
eukprot:CAMPEP_0119537624 /NCGR_PEP_ID=MMETSP1344-20130328/50249_1 /TAXON_ID=236787 /ORGANISM="Florenciella parvula, Strain CCMP2471" /LENGTH=38 /DNA_ID= /DNA_START= /DNA_END= /DNA_ORIENTATION=